MRKFNSVFKKIIFSLGFILCALKGFSQDNKTVITIDNAKTTQYSKAEDRDTDIIILSGDVKISVSKGGTKNVISADTIRYDRASEMMYAEGNVSLEQTGTASGGMNVTASSLMFNTATLEGVFDDGRVVQTKSDALNLPSGSTLVVASDVFGRSESNTIAFKDGVLTFCSDEDPHWKIKASRIWLLPGGEFAFFNAFLYVGLMPVLWLPAFYYPKDELIFNPVMGYDKRKGYFVQTTTYLYGRKPLSTSSSSSSSSDDGSEKLKALFNFVKPNSLKKQVREGLIYHNLDEDFSGDTTNYLKVLGDYYANLGGMVGVEGVFKPKKIVNSLETSLKLGFSDTVRPLSSGSVYSPYFSNGNTVYDHSYFFGTEIPFRYSGNLKFSMSKPFTFSMSLPFYSDPYFTQDFATDREESMDWISFLMSSINQDDDETTSTSEVSSYSWTANGSYSVPLPAFIKPFVNSMSLSLSSDIKFSAKTTSQDSLVTEVLSSASDLSSWKSYTPQRKFYYPSQITPATINGTFSGTILDYSSSKTASKKSVTAPKFTTALIQPEELLTEKEKESAEKAAAEQTEGQKDGEQIAAADAEKAQNAGAESEKEPLPKEALPSLSTVTSSIVSISGLAASIKYSVKPNLTTQLNYASEAIDTAADFSFDKLKSFYYKFQMPVTLDNSLSYGGSFFSLSNNWTYSPVFVDHPYMHINSDSNDKIGVSQDSATSSKATDYASCKQDLSSTNSVSFKPFTNLTHFKDIGITYRNSIKFVRTSFNSDKYKETGETIWDYETVDWEDKDSITTHALDFIIASNQLDNKFSQSLTITTTLKPQTEQYYGTLKLVFPYVTAGFETGVKADTSNEGQWIKQPLKQSLSLSLFNSSLKINESYSYNLEDETPHHDSFKVSASWKNLSLAYVMSYTQKYELDKEKGWQAVDGKDFIPYSMALSYSLGNKTFYTWKNRISMGFNFSTALNADLVRYTNSSFTFSPTLTFKIQDFVNFSFSSTSKNSTISSYFTRDGGYTFGCITEDLLKGFAFGDVNTRQASGFKLKSLNFSVTHELHDWDFGATFKMEPRLVTNDSDGTKEYKLDPYITIAISWRPMSSIKTEIIDKYGEWALQ